MDAVTTDKKDKVVGPGLVKTIEKKKKKRKKRQKKVALTGTELGVDVGGFTVIGDVNQFKKQIVKRVLPKWLAHPYTISCNLNDYNSPVEESGLSEDILKMLKKNCISFLFPVQQQIIPWLLARHGPKFYRPPDMCVSAPTGSGKTLAYALPIIHIVQESKICPQVKAIIVLPTEILATQVYSVFKSYAVAAGLTVFLMTKRISLSAEKDNLIQKDYDGRLWCRYDIVVATPGRLVDHLEKTEGFNISNLMFLVIDEADRTLDDQEANWLERLEAKFWGFHDVEISQPWKNLPLNVRWMPVHLLAFQKLLFSATLSQNPESLEKLHLFQPKLFTSVVTHQSEGKEKGEDSHQNGEKEDIANSFVGKYSTPNELVESFVLCTKETKPLALTYLISHFKWKRVLCFANTKESTHRLCLLLRFMGHLNVREISSSWSPKTRDLVLKKFNDGSIDILVTSDQMARGIDIPSVEYVVSYDLPGHTKTYIHRIGRCARAGKTGQAVCLVLQQQIGMYKKTIKQTGKDAVKLTVKNSDLRPLEESFKAALAQLKSHIEGEASTKRTAKISKKTT